MAEGVSNDEVLAGIEVGSFTHQGARPSQQDRYTTSSSAEFAKSGYAIFCIFDGHGADGFSDHAAANLPHLLVADEEFKRMNYADALRNAFAKEEKQLFETLRENRKGGTTATVVLLLKGSRECYVANVGDSTAVLGSWKKKETKHDAHNPNDIKATPVTAMDHIDNPQEVERLSAAKARVRGTGVVRENQRVNMTRALGDFSFKAMKTETRTDWLSPVPHVHKVTFLPGQDEFMIIATDGLWNVYTEDSVCSAVQDAFQKGFNVQAIAEHLVTSAVSGIAGPDNTTAIVLNLKWGPASNVAVKNT